MYALGRKSELAPEIMEKFKSFALSIGFPEEAIVTPVIVGEFDAKRKVNKTFDRDLSVASVCRPCDVYRANIMLDRENKHYESDVSSTLWTLYIIVCSFCLQYNLKHIACLS